MKTLTEHNVTVLERRYSDNPDGSNVACPACNNEMRYYLSDITYDGEICQRLVICPKCAFTGYKLLE